MNRAKGVANSLLSVGAVKLNVKEPFTFVSGIKSPIYCDNRKMIGYPEERKIVIDGFIDILKDKDFDIVAGTATAGIPWAGFIAERLNVPMAYIRSAKKDHGAGQQIEGASFEGKRVIVIEDLISTGGSSIKAVQAAREAGAKEVEVVAIFSYEFPKAIENFKNANVKLENISNFTTLIELATEKEYLNLEEKEIALKWNKSPNTWKK
ncbi:MAG: orotate phosphoribosyltransferase [Fusobacterium sp. JB021]|nr:orotate phosphoribosyltransferase [Fusobacterium sp. JB020]MDP0494333.1 orotate phosphoribosyltransferase [Fusobacterium sp. JB021]MDP0506298.1 orotate phosphoribosyltransferase [Fusobacterium sp. JB019]